MAELEDYASPVWATYRQWTELGAQVRSGEKSSLVIFYKEFDADPDPDDASDDGKRRLARASPVQRIAGGCYAAPDAAAPLGPVERIAAADRFVLATGARIHHGGVRVLSSFNRSHPDARRGSVLRNADHVAQRRLLRDARARAHALDRRKKPS